MGAQCIFLNFFDRPTEKQSGENESALKSDICDKLFERAEDDKNPVSANAALVEPFQRLFEKLFEWQPSEYVCELKVSAEPGSAEYSKKYQFTLFESDTSDLRQHCDDYKHGGGLVCTSEGHGSIYILLPEHVA